MISLTIILSISAAIFSMTNTYSAYNNYLINKDKYIKDIISDAVEYSYTTYVKDVKKSNPDNWTEDTKKQARQIAIDYFNNNSIYKDVSNIRLQRMIEFKLLEIKTLNK